MFTRGTNTVKDANEELNSFMHKFNEVNNIVKKLASRNKHAQQNEVLETDRYVNDNICEDTVKQNLEPDRKVKENQSDNTVPQGKELNSNIMCMISTETFPERRYQDNLARKEKVATFDQATKAFRKSEYKEALTLYDKAIEQVKDNCLLYINRALTYINLQQYEQAIADAENALIWNKNSVKARWLLARAYFLNGSRGEFKKAVEGVKGSNGTQTMVSDGANFNRGFTIPKKQFKEGNWQNPNNPNFHQFEPLNNAYEEYEEYQPPFQRFRPPRGPPRGFQGPNNFGNHRQFNNNPRFPGVNNSEGPPFQPPFHPNQQFPNARSVPFNPKEAPNHKETPKNSAKYQETYPHLSDPTLPKELTEQFQPLYCKLCAAQLSSNVMAKLHYKSKNHEKKVRKFLVEYSERTGEPLHERAMVTGSKKPKQEEDINPKYFHCDVCDLPLTGQLHAESHYMGKNHHRALAGKNPAGKGHYDDAGNWIRIAPAVAAERGGFGLAFSGTAEEIVVPPKEAKNKLQCELCSVSVTSDQQLAMHVSGQKHKKKVEQQAKEKEDETKVAEVAAKPDDSILSSLACSSISTADLSVYRTPTGYYYCNPCNLSLNSETQFKQHLGSKKHRKKATSTSKEQAP